MTYRHLDARQVAQKQHRAPSYLHLGEEAPPVAPPSTALMIGWSAVVLAAAGVFYGATRGWGMGQKPVTANRRTRK